MNYREWIDYQGALYTYQPACPNLPTGITDSRFFFLFFTWIGRGLILALLIMVAASLFWSFRRIQSGSIWWGAGVIGAGIIMITCAISLNLIGLFRLLFFPYGFLLLLNGLTGLLVRSISRRDHWAKILLLAGYVVGLALLLPWTALEIQVVITRPNSSATEFLNLLYFAASILGLSTLSLILWLLFLGGQWVFRKVRKVPDV